MLFTSKGILVAVWRVVKNKERQPKTSQLQKNREKVCDLFVAGVSRTNKKKQDHHPPYFRKERDKANDNA